MVLPRLLHPVDVVVEQISKATTVYDEDTREPISQPDMVVPVTLPGQVKWNEQYSLDPQKGGAEEESMGYVLFRKVDLDAEGLTIARGDRIAKLGHVETDVYVSRLEWTAHYADQLGPALLKVHFEDRQPSRQSRGV